MPNATQKLLVFLQGPTLSVTKQERLYSRNVWGLQRFCSLVNLPTSMLIHSSWEWTFLIVDIWMHDKQIWQRSQQATHSDRYVSASNRAIGLARR